MYLNDVQYLYLLVWIKKLYVQLSEQLEFIYCVDISEPQQEQQLQLSSSKLASCILVRTHACVCNFRLENVFLFVYYCLHAANIYYGCAVYRTCCFTYLLGRHRRRQHHLLQLPTSCCIYYRFTAGDFNASPAYAHIVLIDSSMKHICKDIKKARLQGGLTEKRRMVVETVQGH